MMRWLKPIKTQLRKAFKRPQKVKKGQHIEPLHHYHVRKRIFHWFEDYPHPQKFKRLMDQGVFIVGALGPIVTLPQLYRVWHYQDPGGLSLFTWIAYIFLALFWVTYGGLHQERAIVFTYTCWILIHIAMVTGILLYS